ncbi:MAG: phosphatase PAP2 family protein [Leadbetterella sp.]
MLALVKKVKIKPRSSLLLLSMFLIVHVSLAQNTLDDTLIRKIYNNRNHKWDTRLARITHSISPVVIGSVFIVPVGYADGISWNWNRALFMSSSSLGSSLLSYGTKRIVKRKRPYEVNPDIKPLDSPHTRSFPSGHTTSAFNLATNLALVYPKWYVIVPAYLYSGTIAYSRLHLGVHYPGDVLAGAALGVGTSFLMNAITKEQKPSPNASIVRWPIYVRIPL